MYEGEREKKFAAIKNAFKALEDARRKKRLPLFRPTPRGYWGTSNLDDLFIFFSKIHLDDYKHFLDMGSGDGRMVFVASLFTHATGIEIDEELMGISEGLKKDLVDHNRFEGDQATFIKGDFMTHSFSPYDFLMAYYDKLFTLELEHKIEREFHGDFYLYNNIYLPHFLKKEKVIWVAQMPFFKIALPRQ
jgi:hypothetical protein